MSDTGLVGQEGVHHLLHVVQTLVQMLDLDVLRAVALAVRHNRLGPFSASSHFGVGNFGLVVFLTFVSHHLLR